MRAIHRVIKAKFKKETSEGTIFTVLVPHESLAAAVGKMSSTDILDGELRLDDSRHITAEQRKKIYATLADISSYLGYMPEELKEIMKYYFISETGQVYFSLSQCSITLAREFINFILDFAMDWSIPLLESGIDRTDDIDRYLYSCLIRRKCVRHGNNGEIHHIDTIGMGNNRKTLDDSKHRKICLCSSCHNEIHAIGVDTFCKKYKVYGIVFNEK